MTSIEVFSYWRSSAAWRVRIALELKRIDYRISAVNLIADGGQQHAETYRALSPEALVPSIRHDGFQLSQSLAICEYLDALWPEPALLPSDPRDAARVRSFCALIACDTHPLNNLRVLQYLENVLEQPDAVRKQWYHHWLACALPALEARVAARSTAFAFGAAPGLAECYLIPQLYNARRFDFDLAACPALVDIEMRCQELPAFVASHPDQQPDKPKTQG